MFLCLLLELWTGTLRAGYVSGWKLFGCCLPLSVAAGRMDGDQSSGLCWILGTYLAMGAGKWVQTGMFVGNAVF